MQPFFFDAVDSTNDAAKRLWHQGAITGPSFVLAREQTAGRGTHGRSWASPRDAGIYLSVVLPSNGRAYPLSTGYTMAAGVATAQILREFLGLEVRLKPVNDIYLSGGKLGGILTETLVHEGRVQVLITGVGINVRRADRCLSDGRAVPICLEDAMPAGVFGGLDLERLVARLIVGVRQHQEAVAEGRDQALAPAWERLKLPGMQNCT